MKTLLYKIIPKSLAWRLISLIIIAFILTHSISIIIFSDERHHALRAFKNDQALEQIAGYVDLYQTVDQQSFAQIAKVFSSRQLQLTLNSTPLIAQSSDSAYSQQLQTDLRQLLTGDFGSNEINITILETKNWWQLFNRSIDKAQTDHINWEFLGDLDNDYHDDDDHEADDIHSAHRHDEREYRSRKKWRRPIIGFLLSVKLDDGQWLNVVSKKPINPEQGGAWIIGMGLSVIFISLVVIFFIRRITKPLSNLVRSTEEFGRGQWFYKNTSGLKDNKRPSDIIELEELKPEGPREIRQLIEVFNQSKKRIQNFVKDRTRMLAAISHDLRTPLTNLRLRVELLEDMEAKEKIIEVLDELQTMTEAALHYARSESEAEETREVDITALVQAISADKAEENQHVIFNFNSNSDEKIIYACRIIAIKRALRNIIDNAATYGQSPDNQKTIITITLENRKTDLLIVISDHGIGIPDDQKKQVFEPFFRLETSRSRETGGTGLGLAIARNIIRNHGGDIKLEDHIIDKKCKGLSVIIILPKSTF